jgi:ATP-binding cassette subfamily B (MDR/TAP) protein 1
VSERVVQEALDNLLLVKKRTTIIIAHRLSTIRNADKIVVFKDGLVVEQGTHDELIDVEGSVYATLVKLQMSATLPESGKTEAEPSPDPVRSRRSSATASRKSSNADHNSSFTDIIRKASGMYRD